MSSLKDKAARILLDDLEAKPAETRVAVLDPVASARSGVSAVTRSIGMHQRVQDLQTQLAAFEDAKLVVQLDPNQIDDGPWKNRHERAYASPSFAQLRNEIRNAGGNVQPVKVRRVPGAQDRYQIIYGRRRTRACRELGLKVSAVVEELDDLAAFKEMDRENRARADLSAWEQGVMYKDALDKGLFPSQRQLATVLDIDHSNLAKAIRLATLPPEVIDAFASPLELQFRWAQELASALEKDTARVLTVAQELREATPRPPAQEVFRRLVGRSDPKKGKLRDIRRKGKVVASWAVDGSGGGTLTVKSGTLSPAKEKELFDAIQLVLASDPAS